MGDDQSKDSKSWATDRRDSEWKKDDKSPSKSWSDSKDNHDWPTPKPTGWPSMKEEDWPTPKPTEWPTPSKSKDWWTPSTTEEEPEYKWTTESAEEWPSKKEDEPSKDSKDSKDSKKDSKDSKDPKDSKDDKKDSKQLKDSKDDNDSKDSKDLKYKDQINLLSKDSDKFSAASANGETDGTSAPTPAPTDDDMKDAFIIVWKPLDLLTFIQIVGILVVLITFCFVIRGVCFGNKEAVRGAKIISDYDSDDSTDDEVDVERQRFH